MKLLQRKVVDRKRLTDCFSDGLTQVRETLSGAREMRGVALQVVTGG